MYQRYPLGARSSRSPRRSDSGAALQPSARLAHVRAPAAGSVGQFQRVLESAPALGPAYVRLTMLYATLGRLDDALDTVRRAYAVDPLLPLLPATDVFVRFWRREFEEATTIGAKAVALHPFLQLGRAFYAQALEFSGRLRGGTRAVSDRIRHVAGIVLAPRSPGGVPREMRSRRGGMGDARDAQSAARTEYVDAYGMAVLRRALGQHDEAFVELERLVVLPERTAQHRHAICVDVFGGARLIERLERRPCLLAATAFHEARPLESADQAIPATWESESDCPSASSSPAQRLRLDARPSCRKGMQRDRLRPDVAPLRIPGANENTSVAGDSGSSGSTAYASTHRVERIVSRPSLA